MTTQAPWSMKKRRPMVAPGWISEAPARSPQAVRYAMGEDGVDAGVGGQDFQRRSGGRIALKNAGEVFPEGRPEAGYGHCSCCHGHRFRHGVGSGRTSEGRADRILQADVCVRRRSCGRVAKGHWPRHHRRSDRARRTPPVRHGNRSACRARCGETGRLPAGRSPDSCPDA